MSQGVGRFFAIVAVLVMISGAVWFRTKDSGGLSIAGGDSKATVVCASELGSVCSTIATRTGIVVVVEPLSTTAERLGAVGATATSVGVDGWIAPSSWIEMTRQRAVREGRTPVLGTPTGAIARSPLVVVMDSSRFAVAQQRCNGAYTWRCQGDVMSRRNWLANGGDGRWGTVKVGVGDPESTASGLATLSALTTGYLGRTDVDALDLDGDSGYNTWIANASAALVPGSVGGDPLSTMLTAGPSVYDTVIGPEATFAPQLFRAARRQSFTLAYPTPLVTIDVAFAPVGSDDRLTRTMRSNDVTGAFGAGGWRTDGRVPAGADQAFALPVVDNLPPVGIQEKLRQKWRSELRR